MTPRRKQLTHARGLEPRLAQTHGGTEAGSSGSDYECVVGVVYYCVVSGGGGGEGSNGSCWCGGGGG